MSYTALYRKFRPSTFEDVKGQDHIVTTLKKSDPRGPHRSCVSVLRNPRNRKNDDRQDSRPLGQLRTSRGRKPVQRMSDV